MNNTSDSTKSVSVATERCCMHDLMRAGRMLEDRLEEALGKAGLSRAQLSVLRKLSEAGDSVSLSDLAAALSCVRSNMTQLVDRLERDGLVSRVDDPADRRSVRAALTPLGRTRAEDGVQIVRQMQAAFSSTLPEPDRAALQRVLSVLRQPGVLSLVSCFLFLVS
jgi:DNA-binding MarR family transcriptional regulator